MQEYVRTTRQRTTNEFNCSPPSFASDVASPSSLCEASSPLRRRLAFPFVEPKRLRGETCASEGEQGLRVRFVRKKALSHDLASSVAKASERRSYACRIGFLERLRFYPAKSESSLSLDATLSLSLSSQLHSAGSTKLSRLEDRVGGITKGDHECNRHFAFTRYKGQWMNNIRLLCARVTCLGSRAIFPASVP